MEKQRFRLVNRDGSFNISRRGLRTGLRRDAYHRLLSVSWPRFLALLAGLYFTVNLVFALAYTLCGPGALEGAATTGLDNRYFEAFFFSVQTLATIGYGKITPVGIAANLLVTVEALFGMFGIALMSGLLFARFSRPTARVKFSKVALISPQDGVPCFMFRMANARVNQIVEARVRVSLARNEVTAEGERYRNFYNLELERSESPIFALSWTVVHPITDSSPLKGMTFEQLEQVEAELFVSLTGIDETFSQTIHSRVSYLPSEIAWGGFYEDMLTRDDNRNVVLNLDRIDAYRMG
jgi:inward rectifier potassium channel